MLCPHCRTTVHDASHVNDVTKDTDGDWKFDYFVCPACKRAVIYLVLIEWNPGTRGVMPTSRTKARLQVYPKGSTRPNPSAEVTVSLAEDYKEACIVLPDSPKSSAALGRRCLQQLLKEKAATTKKDLADQIQEVLDSKTLPSHLSEAIDAVRNIGNFAAHPLKSKSTGEILPVEPGEAEWTLDTLEQLFDFYFDQPAKTKLRRDALNKKLADAGKPPLKS